SLFEAVQLALKNVIGAYAIAIIDKSNPNQLIAARKGSPLIIGVGEKEFLIGSDATPIVEYTKDVIYLEEEQIAVMRRNGDITITDLSNVQQTPIIKTLELNLSQLEKANFPHFMLKEIFEQPEALRTSMLGRLNMSKKIVKLSGIIDHKDKFLKAKRIIICACGTSWHAGLIGKYIIEELTRIPVEVEYSSEFRYRNPVIKNDDIVIAISQSGETADTLAAIKLAKDNGAFVYGICNVVGSSIARASDTGSYLHVGPEIGVASTKAFTAQVTTLTLMALNIAEEKKTISKERTAELVEELQRIPDKINQTLQMNMRIKLYAQIFTYARNFIYLGRGFNYPVALEGALKLKEISYIHAEGYPAAEMKHGPIALIDEEMPVVVIAPKRGMYEKVLSNIQEVKARKGKIISIVTKGDTAVKELSDFCLEIPDTEECFVPILSVVPLQLLSYHIAIAKGRNVDQPRNLAKSVTVE
ncbi:MAG: glutamine--fructose-6-phosphate transaminase (isomerizing), partial [Bacteroidales bacterium]|nr:glutamine--fructose-6-phosphate transaminase (isomerizing) [Bacteroidales bacterium]